MSQDECEALIRKLLPSPTSAAPAKKAARKTTAKKKA